MTEASAVNDGVQGEVLGVLLETLQLDSQAGSITAETPLLGSIPELDSMAVVSVLTGVEDRFGFVIDDDEISAEAFETLGTLCDFVRQKLEQ